MYLGETVREGVRVCARRILSHFGAPGSSEDENESLGELLGRQLEALRAEMGELKV